MDLTVKLGKIRMANPVTVASGTFGYGREYADLMDLNELGGIFTKAITYEPRMGNPGPRVVETPSGMLNAIGLANVGVKAFLRDKLPFLRKHKARIFVNVAGSTIPEYEKVVRALEGIRGIHGLEINISCPNVKHGGMAFGTDARQTGKLLTRLRKITTRPLIAKLSPNVSDIAHMAGVAEEAGCDAISLINTLVGMVIDVEKRKPHLANGTGGLSGPAIRPVGVAMVWKVARAVKIPIIGIGGIMDANDALQYLLAGATAVQIGTGLFVDPQIPARTIKGIEAYSKRHGLKSMREIVGKLNA